MSTSRCKIVIVLLLIWCGGSIGIWCQKIAQSTAGKELKMVFCDVGQGDATLLSDGEYQVLIDGGPDAKVLRCLKKELPDLDRQIETVILTHPDADHVIGLTAVLNTYQVKRVIWNNLPKDSVEFREFYERVQELKAENNLEIWEVNFAQKWCETENICLEVVSELEDFLPEKVLARKWDFRDLSDMIKKFVPKSLNYNNWSIVLNCQIGDKKLTVAGDVEEEMELAMVRKGVLTKVDVLKTAHHGAKTSSSKDFVSILRPEYSVISCGAGNSYGHPNKETLETLNAASSQIWRTDERGTVKYVRQNEGSWRWVFERSGQTQNN